MAHAKNVHRDWMAILYLLFYWFQSQKFQVLQENMKIQWMTILIMNRDLEWITSIHVQSLTISCEKNKTKKKKKSFKSSSKIYFLVWVKIHGKRVLEHVQAGRISAAKQGSIVPFMKCHLTLWLFCLSFLYLVTIFSYMKYKHSNLSN